MFSTTMSALLCLALILTLTVETSEKISTVHMLCGQIGAGKSFLAQKLAAQHNAVVFSADKWVLSLHGRDFPNERFGEVGDQVKEMIWEQVLMNPELKYSDFNFALPG